ncbi:Leucine carboxyl methyltransferase [Nakaseomyces glabratus]|nr:Leucine carboxyl methyltransferase [Nakaseomyces glabratus]KAH7594586.1 Leucine carboxyl methyltransferase [Nakaseomyces glabratus]KAI8387682.1 Leucine carboxyl methyltransferase [Nakaseomyces glabratus]QNG13451.1 uncharacterized protein GWK60_F02915 [Nakaseomyces glabratus]SCV17010.1 Leucine carboxyl methyltransferase 1 [Nakaseomyces glabratus]
MELAVQRTDTDALSSKVSAIHTKYLSGGISQQFAYEEVYGEYLASLRQVSRRVFGKCRYSGASFPVMNYGTYLRTVAIDERVLEFLQCNGGSQVQIVNIGCGSDLRMVSVLAKHSNVKYIDLDFKESVELKRQVLEKSSTLSSYLKNDNYVLRSCDLRDVPDTLELLNEECKPELPTLIISECVLCYMPEKETQSLIDGILHLFKNGSWVSYDPMGGSDKNDRFGVIMQQNLRDSRQLEMPTLLINNSPEIYASRWTPNSDEQFERVVTDMWTYYNDKVPAEEKQRIKRLQFLDELEELKVMQSHYVIFFCKWNANPN